MLRRCLLPLAPKAMPKAETMTPVMVCALAMALRTRASGLASPKLPAATACCAATEKLSQSQTL